MMKSRKTWPWRTLLTAFAFNWEIQLIDLSSGMTALVRERKYMFPILYFEGIVSREADGAEVSWMTS